MPSALQEKGKNGAGRRFGWVAILIAMMVGGMMTYGGGLVFAWASTEAYCISCHEMRDNVYAEFEFTVHDENRTGVRATCADCHVPKETIPMLIDKVKASVELYGHLTGKIDTPEKFEAHRPAMAKKVWAEMRANDSRECRSCHEEDAMSTYAMSDKAKDRHEEGRAEGLTCIDCHFGIAHSEPKGEMTPQDIGVTIRK